MSSLVKLLKSQLGKGYSVDNLENMRKFYLAYHTQFQISENSSRKLPNQFLSWSHYLFLSRITNTLERNFYEIEALQNNWKLKDLERQFDSGLFIWAWIFGAFTAFMDAMIWSELGAKYPLAGGTYNFHRIAFGEKGGKLMSFLFAVRRK